MYLGKLIVTVLDLKLEFYIFLNLFFNFCFGVCVCLSRLALPPGAASLLSSQLSNNVPKDSWLSNSLVLLSKRFSADDLGVSIESREAGRGRVSGLE